VLPDEPGLNRTFDYLLPASLRASGSVRVGSIVRFTLHGRPMRGWVTGVDVTPATGAPLRPISKVSGLGPPRELLSLSKWAALRWWGRPATLLRTASPDRGVHELPRARPIDPAFLPSGSGDIAAAAREALGKGGVTLVRVPPTADTVAVVIEAARHAAGSGVLVLTPTFGDALHVARSLRRIGAPVALLPDDWALAAAGGCVAVGARGAAWAPMAAPGVIVVLDEHDEAYQQEQMPTWNARDVAVERSVRGGVPCLLVSPTPSVAACERYAHIAVPRSFERAHWPRVEVVDRHGEEPGRQGLLSDQLTSVLRSPGTVVCVLNRKGRASSLVCVGCGAVACCEHCDGAMALDELAVSPTLRCRRCDRVRPSLCASCGRSRFKGVRMGVTRAREEIEALSLRPTFEVTGDSATIPETAEVIVGTEAVLHRVSAADTVVFLDLDSELLAPRYRASEQVLALFVRASRLLAGRGGVEGAPGRIVVQTRLADHDVVRAAVLGDPMRAITAERERRLDLALPPFSALARVSGAAMHDVVAQLRNDSTVRVGGPPEGPMLVRADNETVLSAALGRIDRPAQRVRIEVDPLR
jgi:primosomal protein N' (replication factor Y)